MPERARSTRQRQPARIAAVLVTVVVLAGSLLLTACRVLTPGAWVFVVATSFVPFALLGYLLAAVLLWWLRRGSRGEPRRWTAATLVVALAGAAVHVGLLVPAYVGGHPQGRPDLTVMTLNLRLGQADAAEVVDLVRRSEADVVVLEEVTDQAAQALVDAGLRRGLPHVAGSTGVISEGTVVVSRFRLSDVRRLPVTNGAWTMQVHARHRFTLVAVHASQPFRQLERWRDDHAEIRRAVRAADGPLVVVGDFNATLDHAPVRRLLGSGLHDAAREANSGWQPTWPGDPDAYHGLPFGIGLMTLDHVLLRDGLGAVGTRTAVVGSSDHRALVADLAWR